MSRIRLEKRYSAAGTPFDLWVPDTLRMPRIPDIVLHSSAYLYRSHGDAKRGSSDGASAFILGVPFYSEEPLNPDASDRLRTILLRDESPFPRNHLYLVTNKHALDHGMFFARFNTLQSTQVINLTRALWVRHEGPDEVAICPLPNLYGLSVLHSAVSLEMILTKVVAEQLSVGPGDDVFMIGRFVGHDGERRNLPMARSGHIAMMPLEPIGKRRQEAFLVEANSMVGFSGSPVFVRIPPGDIAYYRQDPALAQVAFTSGFATRYFAFLLGINFAHMPSEVDGVTDGGESVKVTLNAGLICVAPAWKILEVLNDHRLIAHRAEQVAEDERRQEASRNPISD